MKSKRVLSTQRNEFTENRFAIHIEASTPRSNEKYRNSVAIDYRLASRESSQGWNRHSVNIGSCGKVPRVEEGSQRSIQTMQSIRNTLNQLQLRIDSAKEELKGNMILGRSVIQEEDNEQSRTLDLISFNDSENSRRTEENNRILYQKRPQKRQLQLVDLTKVKTYYKSELAKIFISGNPRAREHLIHSWKIINAYRSMFDPNPELTSKRIQTARERCEKKVLAIGLDSALIYCSNEKKNEEDIDIRLPNLKGEKECSYLSIRPHAISFLKKMGKKFEIVIFSNRNKEETDLILEQLDPLSELISLRLYNNSCYQVGNLQVKDLRVLKRDLSSVILVDSLPCSYLQQPANGVPLLPYSGGSDSELYALEKYLQQLGKSKDIREPNGNYFQLMKYGDWEEPLEGVKGLYFSKR